MRRFLTLTALVVLAAPAVLAQANRAADEKQIIANERRAHEAIAKGDAAAFLALLAPDAIAVDPMMGVAKAADFAAMFKDMKIQNWNIDESRVHWLNADAAIHTFRWTGKGVAMGQTFSTPMRSTTVWVRQGGKWLAAFHQETEITPPPPAKK
jgi:uncharacterized protein (TIGR02246 family)